MAAAWMAQTGVKALLIDERSDHRFNGRADGLESRTIEILDSFGLADKVWAEANHTVEISLWVSLHKIFLVIYILLIAGLHI
jgi:phenol 2-monooxygenase